MYLKSTLNILSSGRGLVGYGLRGLILCLLIMLVFLVDAAAQVKREGQIKPVIKTPPPKVVPVSVRESIEPTGVDIVLPPPDLGEIRGEDKALSGERRAKRIGIVRQLPSAVSFPLERASKGRWVDLKGGGSVWTLTIQSSEAEAIRLHLENVKIAKGTQIMIYNTDHPQESYGPYDKKYLHGELDLWTESVFGSKVTIECYISPGGDIEDASFNIRELAHVYKKVSDLLPKVGTCHNDVMCYDDWLFQANGVAYITTVFCGFVWQCTGSLLGDFDDETWEDYFLTANHCLNCDSNTALATQVAANTMEFYWFFQSACCPQDPSCTWTPPNVANVPRTTGGADLISAQTEAAGNDHCFLRIRNETPGGVTYEGWTTETPTGGIDPTILTGIHHPAGSWKRISFTDVTHLTSDANYWEIEWYSGVTEPGSSGSPLFDGDHLVIGQLFGGGSDCTNPQGHDWYGRFNVTYPNIVRWLEIGGTIHVDRGYTGTELGTPTQPFNTVGEANNFAWDGVRIKIKAGSYTETLTFSRSLTVLGTGGTVVIGE